MNTLADTHPLVYRFRAWLAYQLLPRVDKINDRAKRAR